MTIDILTAFIDLATITDIKVLTDTLHNIVSKSAGKISSPYYRHTYVGMMKLNSYGNLRIYTIDGSKYVMYECPKDYESIASTIATDMFGLTPSTSPKKIGIRYNHTFLLIPIGYINASLLEMSAHELKKDARYSKIKTEIDDEKVIYDKLEKDVLALKEALNKANDILRSSENKITKLKSELGKARCKPSK